MEAVAVLPVYIRWMIRSDMPQVLAVEEASFAWDAWTEEDFCAALRERNVIGMVASDPRHPTNLPVYGYMVYELHDHHIRIASTAVGPDCRRRGVGDAMVRKLIGKLSAHRRTRLVADVAESNVGAQLFFRAMGFRAAAVLRGCYADGDAYRMAYALPGTEDEEWDWGSEESEVRGG